MRHPNEGVLRRLLDEPAGVADSDREHIAGCPQCLGGLVSARADATLVDTALAIEDSAGIDIAAAWRRLSTAAVSTDRTHQAVSPRARRSLAALRRPVVAAVAFAVVLAGAGTAAANDWLPIFRTKQITAVSLNTADLISLPDLTAYGDVDITGAGDIHRVADASAAAAETGLEVPDVTTMPRGVSGEPEFQVLGEVTATFTFSAGRAARAAADAGKPLPPVPPGLDGSTVRLVAGPGLAQVWSQPSGVPSLVVGRAVAPSAFSSGVPFEAVRDYLLSLPGLPADVAAQLRTFSADGSTLPLPVPADQVTTSTAQVNGVQATVLAARDRTMAAVVWVSDGVVTVVAGALDADEVLSIARDLR